MKKSCIATLAIILLLGYGCSEGGRNLPTSPPQSIAQATSPASSHTLWGFWQVGIDTRTETVDIVPLRDTPFHANVVSFLQPPYPNGLGIEIHGMDKETGLFDLIVRLTHPFDDPTYTGFDVKGILISEGSAQSHIDPSLRFTDTSETRLLNADGWTRWWNQPEFTASGVLGYTEGLLGTKGTYFNSTLNPFKYFADELGPNDALILDPNDRGAFTPMKKTNSRQYLIRFPMESGHPVLVFNYAVDANWEAPDGDPYYLASFPPEANMPEPYRVAVTDAGSTAFYDSDSGKFGGALRLHIDVCDWAIVDMSTIMVELGSVRVESDTLFNGDITLDEDDIIALDDHCATFELEVIEVDPTSVAGQEVLIHAVAAEGTYDQGFGSPAPNKPLTSYAVFEVPIRDTMPVAEPPTGLTVDIHRDAGGKLNGWSLDWDDSPDAVEYNVYLSDDPYEYQGPLDMEITPESPLTDSSYQHSVYGADLNGQWMVWVTASAIWGESESESDPTWALIDFEAWEPYSEGQNEWRRRFNISRNKFQAVHTSTLGVANTGTLLLSPSNQLAGFSITYCVSPELPDIPGATHCFFEFAHKRAQNHPDDYGYSICSASEIQDPNVIEQYLQGPIPPVIVVDYNVDTVPPETYMSGDQMNDADDYIEGLYDRYNDPGSETGDPAAGWTGLLNSFVVSRYEVPGVLEDDHLFAGVCYGAKSEGYTYPLSGYSLICDEFALAIY